MDFKQQLVNFSATDGVILPGALFEPAKKSRKALILLHGNGSSSVFRDIESNLAMAEIFTKAGISLFAFDNRGAHIINRLHVRGKEKKRVLGGTAYEKIKDCIKDIDGAVAFLKNRGYREFYLIGYSTGANKICVYNYYKKQNPIKKYILVGGGDDSGIYYNQFGRKKFHQLLKLSKQKIKQGKGKELIPYEKIGMVYSYQGLEDILNPNGDYNTFPFHYYFHKLAIQKKKSFKEFAKIAKPALVIYGEKDEFCYGLVSKIVETLKQQSKYPGNKQYRIFKQGDHSLHGKEKKLAGLISSWLTK